MAGSNGRICQRMLCFLWCIRSSRKSRPPGDRRSGGEAGRCTDVGFRQVLAEAAVAAAVIATVQRRAASQDEVGRSDCSAMVESLSTATKSAPLTGWACRNRPPSPAREAESGTLPDSSNRRHANGGTAWHPRRNRRHPAWPVTIRRRVRLIPVPKHRQHKARRGTRREQQSVGGNKKSGVSESSEHRFSERGERESNPRVTDLQSVALATWLPPRE